MPATAQKMLDDKQHEIHRGGEDVVSLRATHAKMLKAEQDTVRELPPSARQESVKLRQAQEQMAAEMRQRDEKTATLEEVDIEYGIGGAASLAQGTHE